MSVHVFEDGTEAREACGDGQQVCAYFDEKGRPRFWLVDETATDDEVEAIAFKVKHGRAMNDQEGFLQGMVREFADA